jgi:outer membrane protein insertion porin family
MLSALAISISFASPAAADPAELTEGVPIDGVRLSGLDDPKAEARWLALLVTRPGAAVRAEEVAADIRRLWQTEQFSQVRAEINGGELVFAVTRRAPAPEVEELKPPEVSPNVSVELAGNRGIGDREARRVLATHEKPLDRDELWRDELRLRALYRDRGFFEAKISAPSIQLSGDRRRATVRFQVDEGPRYRFGAVAEGLDGGRAYSHTAVLAGAAAIAARLGGRGHAFASVDPKIAIHPATRTVDVAYAVEPGPVARVAAVIIRGNSKTRDRVIRREIEIVEGDPYDAAAIDRSRRRIAALGFFDEVSVTATPGTDEREAVVTFAVKERATGMFQVGAGFSTLEEFVARASIEQANLFGTGQSLGMSAHLSAVRQLFLVRWSNPRIGDTRWRVSADLYNTRRAWNGFVRDAVGASATIGRPLSDRVSASLTYRLEEVSAVSGDSIWASARGEQPIGPDLFHDGVVSSLRATLAYDSRDDRLRPTRGAEAGVFAEIASPLFGSQVELGRAGAWLRAHQPAGPIGVHAGAEVGLVSTRDPAGVPLAHRYQLGGLDSLRGYEPGSLGPRIKLGGDPEGALGEIGLGGNLMAKATLELTAPLIPSIGLGGVVFTDVGNVFNLDRRYCEAVGCPRTLSALTRGLRASVGFGIRWLSPLGPLRFEWGIPLFRRPGDPWIRFHFGLGLGL